MSLETLAILNQQRADMIELDPSSETFNIVGGGSFEGIFDLSHVENNKDNGNITQKKLNPTIMVPIIPSGLRPMETQIKRVGWLPGDKVYTFQFAGNDSEGVPVLWLF